MDIRKFLGKPGSKTSSSSRSNQLGPSLRRSHRESVSRTRSSPGSQRDRSTSSRVDKKVAEVVDLDSQVDDKDNLDDDDDDVEFVRKPVRESRSSRRLTSGSSPSMGKSGRAMSRRKSSRNRIVADDDDDDYDPSGAMDLDADEEENDEEQDENDFVGTAKAKTAGRKRPRPAPDVSYGDSGGPTGAGFGAASQTAHEDEIDQEPQEKKSKQAQSYAKFMNRGPPPNKGNVEIPVGRPNCLEGKVFVITGVLDSLERDDCADLIKQYGGRCVSAVSRKVTHGVVGADPGDSKLKKLREMKTPLLDEAKLLAMIRDSNTAKHGAPSSSKLPPRPVQSRSRAAKVSPARQGLPVRDSSSGRDSGKSPSATSNLWVDKYRPSSPDELVANPGIHKQIADWLVGWKSRFLGLHTGKHGARSKASSSSEEGRCLLLAGPPGIGKTTAAHVICRANGYEPHELNASDVRNKAGVQTLAATVMAGANISQFLEHGSTSRGGGAPKAFPNGVVLIMDEVDGMSGGDRGGSQELIKMIKTSRVPIICICNDDSSQKMRTLANHCLRLRFRRPMATQVRDRILLIARKEGFREIDGQTAERLAEGCHGDIRQVINLLQTWRSTSSTLSFGDVKSRLQVEGKTLEQLNIFDVFPKFFAPAGSGNSVVDRMDNFFLDSDLMPLFVAENYLSTRHAKHGSGLDAVADASDAISEGNVCGSMVRRDQRWDLMPTCSILSCVLPGSLLSGGLGARPMFPSYLGAMSKTSRFTRTVRELEMRFKAADTSSGSSRSFRLEYTPSLTVFLATPLIKGGASGIPDVIERLDAYYMQKDDWNAVMELGVFKDKCGPLDAIPGTVKSALTREYNKLSHVASSVTAAKIGAKGAQDFSAQIGRANSGTPDAPVIDEDPGSGSDDGEKDTEDADDVEAFKVKPAKSSTARGRKQSAKTAKSAPRRKPKSRRA